MKEDGMVKEGGCCCASTDKGRQRMKKKKNARKPVQEYRHSSWWRTESSLIRHPDTAEIAFESVGMCEIVIKSLFYSVNLCTRA